MSLARGKTKIARSTQQKKDWNLFLYIVTPKPEATPLELQREIEARIASGAITQCTPGARTLKQPHERRHRHTAPLGRLSGKVT
jgi:hypothetical protein